MIYVFPVRFYGLGFLTPKIKLQWKYFAFLIPIRK
jgi:hypothetical protein